MPTKKFDLNRFRRSSPLVQGEPDYIYTGGKYLGYTKAAITSGAEAFIGRFQEGSDYPGPPFIPLKITLTQSGGTFGYCRLDVSGETPDSFQLIEINGRSVGPHDLGKVGTQDLLSMGWSGGTSTFIISVKAGITIGDNCSAAIKIVDFDGSLVKITGTRPEGANRYQLDLSALPEDTFMNAALKVTSANLLAAWSAAPATLGGISEDDDTMYLLTGSNMPQIATATTVDSSTSPSIMTTGLTSFSLSRGIANSDSPDPFAPTAVLADPLPGFPGTDWRGSWFLVFQGDSVSDTDGNQANMFIFGGISGLVPYEYLKKQAVSAGVSNDYMFMAHDFDAVPGQLPTAAATTVSIVLTRDNDGAVNFYSQPAGSASIATPNTGQMGDNPQYILYWGDDPTYPARWELFSSNSGERLEFTLLAVLMYDDELSAADIADLNEAVV